jgi:DNA polymerase-3 subunit epsilon
MLILGVDFETTGLDRVTDEIIEVGAVLWDSERKIPVSILSHIVRPAGREVSPEIAKLTGIDQETVKRFGVPFDAIACSLRWMSEQAEYYCAHNAPFDRGFLEASVGRYQITSFAHRPWIDTRTDLPERAYGKSSALNYLAADHGFVNPFKHRAVFDVMTMFRIMSEYDLDDILALQASPTVRLVANVSFELKDRAKEAGFHWDPATREWFRNVKQIHLAGMSFEFPVKEQEVAA